MAGHHWNAMKRVVGVFAKNVTVCVFWNRITKVVCQDWQGNPAPVRHEACSLPISWMTTNQYLDAFP